MVETRDVPVTPERRAADLLDDLLDIAHALECAPDLEAILAAITKLKDVAAYERGRADERLRIAAACGLMATENEHAGRNDAAKALRGMDAWIRALPADAIRARSTTEGH